MTQRSDALRQQPSVNPADTWISRPGSPPHGGAQPDGAVLPGLVDHHGAAQNALNRLDAPVEHPELLSGVVVGEVFLQISVLACGGHPVHHWWPALVTKMNELFVECRQTGSADGNVCVLGSCHTTS